MKGKGGKTGANYRRDHPPYVRSIHASELYTLNMPAINKQHIFNNEPHAIKHRYPLPMTPLPRTSPRSRSRCIRRVHPQCLRTSLRRRLGDLQGLGSFRQILPPHQEGGRFPKWTGIHPSHPRHLARPYGPAHPTRCPAACSPGALIVTSLFFLHSGYRFTAMHQRLCGCDSPIDARTWQI